MFRLRVVLSKEQTDKGGAVIGKCTESRNRRKKRKGNNEEIKGTSNSWCRRTKKEYNGLLFSTEKSKKVCI